MSSSCKLGEWIQSGIHAFYYKWGHFVGRKPWTVIGVSTFIALIPIVALLIRLPIETETRSEYLFAPQDSDGFNAMLKYKDTWGSTQTRVNELIVTTKVKGGNVLTASVLKEAQRLDSLVSHHVHASSGLSEDAPEGEGRQPFGRTYGRSDLCYPKASQPNCQMTNSALELFYKGNGTYDFEHTDLEIAAIVERGYGIDPARFPEGAAGRKVNTDSLFGGRTYDADGKLQTAAALNLVYYMEGGDEGSEVYFINRAWEEQVDYLIDPVWTDDPPLSEGSATNGTVTWDSDVVTVYPITDGALDREGDKAVDADVSLFTIGIQLLTVYACLVALSPKDMMKSRLGLMAKGLLASGMAIGVSYGLASLFVKNNLVISVLPFVLLGIGVDDTFVLMQGLAMFPPITKGGVEMDVPERMANTLALAGASITVTSLTDIIAFVLGTTSSLPGLQAFCVFAVFGVLGDFLLQISFFAGWMALDARRQAAGKHDLFCLNPCGASTPPACKRYFTLQELVQRYYVPLLRHKAAKAVVLTVFIGFCGAMAYCASNLEQDFDQRWFVPSDAKLWDAFDVDEEYFKDSGSLPVYVVTPSTAAFDYTSVAGQDKLLALTAAVSADPHVGGTVDWYTPLRAWAHECVPAVAAAAATLPAYCTGGDAGPITMVTSDGATPAGAGAALGASYLPPARFYEYLAEYLSSTTNGERLSPSIKWRAQRCAEVRVSDCSPSEHHQGLAASQLTTYLVLPPGSDGQVKRMRGLRDSVAKAELGDTYAYSYVFVFFEQFAIIIREAIVNLGLAGLACFCLVLLTVSNFIAAFYVLLMVVMVDVDILGLMWLSGLTIDSVTIINLVLAIGLVVDYSAHIAHSFVVAKGTRQERADHALSFTGSAVFHGAMSTFVAVVVMSASTSYVFRVFFIQFFGICIFGMAHGLVFLPVLLSLVGPGEINVGAPAVKEEAVQEAQPATAAKGGVAMGSVASEVVNEA
mmetsp:Transcript_14418/g.34118  ORF Transcript_14418/g.34118 Transcript_14418/m.34118 type:complete len:977 (+) Transcript_14418:69-2999(+)